MQRVREQLSRTVEKLDDAQLPPRFADARARLCETLAALEADGVREETLIAAIVNEALPRLLARHGLLGTGAILRRLADGLDPQSPPGLARQ